MRIEIIPLLSDNYAYLVICESTGLAAVVDPAEAAPVLARVEQLDVELVAIWTTHHHWDHTGGNAELRAATGATIVAHRSGRVEGAETLLDDGETTRLGELVVEVAHTPGHTLDSLVYRVEDAAFTGDALFGAGCGRLFEGDAPMLYRSLNERLAGLPAETRMFFGHEYTEKNLAFAASVELDNEALRRRVASVADGRRRGEPSVPSTWADESATNPFLRCDRPEIARRLAAMGPKRDLGDPIEVFAALRELRNRW